MRYQSLIRTQLTIAATALLLVTGCGAGGHGQVSGRVVRADGGPLAGARVIARSSTGKSVVGITEKDGNYTLNGKDPGSGVESGDYTAIVMEDRGQTDSMRPATIAAKYADPAQSGLSFNVQPGEKKTFDITVDPR